MLRRILSLTLSFALLFSQTGMAQVTGEFNLSSYLGKLHSNPIERLRLPQLRYFSYNNTNGSFRIMLDKGDLKEIKGTQLQDSARKLLTYFLIGVTLPNESFWVNLRPDSADNIIDDYVGQTELGKVLLEADLELKKDTARFTSPETPEGKQYWDKLYHKAEELFGSENTTIPTLTRPWIVPGEVIIRETRDSAYVYKATLKVMLEQDYLKDSAVYKFDNPRLKALNEYSSQLIRGLIIPKLTKEVNISKRYAALRQVYYSLILARWFKSRFYDKGGAYSSLIDKKDLNGLLSTSDWSKMTYFKEYQKSFKSGEYNLSVPVNGVAGQSIRNYFSGGIGLTGKEMEVPVAGARNRSVNPISGFRTSSPVLPNFSGAIILSANPESGSPLPKAFKEDGSLASSSPINPSSLLQFKRVGQEGEQIWIDGLNMEMLSEGGYFEDLVANYGVTGVTTNPSLIKAYLRDPRVLAKAEALAKQGLSTEEVYYELIKDLATRVISIFKRHGVKGKFSVELDPTKADNAQASIKEAMRWTDIDPEYMMVKVAANEAGYNIIEEVTARGRNVNATLIFSPEQYRKVAEAYIRGLKRALAAGLDISRIYSVASFFISRWDVKFASQIPSEYHGMFANAVAIVAYNEIFKKLFGSAEFQALKARGARVQDFLLASTGSKAGSMPEAYRDKYSADVYVTAIQGSNVVNTLPDKTIEYLKTIEVTPQETIVSNYSLAKEILAAMQAKGVDIEQAGEDLFKVGMGGGGKGGFIDDFNSIQQTLADIVKKAQSGVASSPVQGQVRQRAEEAAQLVITAQRNEFDRRNQGLMRDKLVELFSGEEPSDLFGFGPYLTYEDTFPDYAGGVAQVHKIELRFHKTAGSDYEIDESATNQATRSMTSKTIYSIRIQGLNAALRALSQAKVSARSSGVASSPLDSQPKTLGGIDFRAIPLTIQPLGNLGNFNFTPPSITALQKIDLDDELKQIQFLLSKGIIPSGERIKEYIYACCYKQELSRRAGDLTSFLTDVCKLQEEYAQESDLAFKESLMLVDAGGVASPVESETYEE